MRFVCESCQARYVVPDDRIQGRTLKVRCKRCGNLMLIKGPSEARSSEPSVAAVVAVTSPVDQARFQDRPIEATQTLDASGQRHSVAQPTAAGPDPSAEEQPEWHVILPEGQRGPLPLGALIQKMVSGEMPPRSYVWRDGMTDWKRAEQVPEVARWLPAARPASTVAASGDVVSGQTSRRIETGSGWFVAGTQAGDERVGAVESTRTATGSMLISEVKSDHLARVANSPELASARPGELTKFYITQALTKPRSPWVLLAFGLGALLLLVGGLIGLAEMGVTMPLVSTESGSRPKIFSGSQSDPHVRDLLLGHPKPGANPGNGPGQRLSPQGRGEPGSGQDQGPLAKRADQHVDQLGKSDKDQLSRLYASQDLSNLKLKSSQSALPVLDRPDAPLTPEQVSRTVGKFQTGYTRCIDAELKRNPSFQGGKIRIVTTIMSSGLVRQAQIVSDDQRLQRAVAGGALGNCLSEQTRRMVFPSFQGDPFDAEIPLVLSSAL